MDEALTKLIQEVVNSRAKLDVLYYYYRNPYAWESLTGLAQRLHRTPSDIETAVHDLTREGLLSAQTGRAPGNELVYNYCREPECCVSIDELMAAYEGAERKSVLQAIMRCDKETRVRALARKRAMDDMRTRFVSMVTHELRTPVTVIRSILGALEVADSRDTAASRALLSRGLSQCDRLASLVENLLVLSGMQTGHKLELYLGEVGIPRLLADLRERFNGSTDRVLQFEATDAPPMVVADEYLLGQILEELLRNAIKFSPSGGTIVLTVTQQDEQVVFTVDDAGIGMSQRQINRAFEPFYQGEEDASRLAGGLGVGLFLARTIAESHGGHIWLEPRPAGGLRVGFSLPITGPTTTA